MSKLNEHRVGYKKTKVGWIPNEWDINLLGSIGSFSKGKGISNSEKKETGLACITYGEIYTKHNYVINNICFFIDIETAKKSQRIKKNDVLFAGSGETLDEIGKCVAFTKDVEAYAGGDIVIFHPKKANSIFLSYALNSDFIIRYRRKLGQGHSVVHIYSSGLKKLHVPLPPLPEQKKIAEILSAWDRAIEQLGKLIEVRAKRFKGLVQTLIADQCDNWNHLKGKDIFDSISEKNHPDKELLSVTQDRGVIPRKMLEGKVMSPEGSTAMYKLIKKGDFVISLRSFQGGIEYSNYQGIISPAYTVLRPKVALHDEFYRHFFKTYLFIEKYLRIAVIGIRDGKQISIPDFMTVKIPHPPLEQQKEIAETLSIAQYELDILKKLADTYRKQKRGLMQKLLIGSIRVKTD